MIDLNKLKEEVGEDLTDRLRKAFDEFAKKQIPRFEIKLLQELNAVYPKCSEDTYLDLILVYRTIRDGDG